VTKSSAQKFLQDVEDGSLVIPQAEFEGLSEEQIHQLCLSKGYDFTKEEMFEVVSDNKDRLKISDADLALITGGKGHLSTGDDVGIGVGAAVGGVAVGAGAVVGGGLATAAIITGSLSAAAGAAACF
jgi:hypothetical protein